MLAEQQNQSDQERARRKSLCEEIERIWSLEEIKAR
jgi:hypothetical protein